MSSPISFPELYKAGFDDFIIPSHETAPNTTIQNRAKVTRSLKAVAGVERVHVKGINRLQNEFGPNGEQVWEADNKDSRIRFVGGITSPSETNGSYISLNSTSDFVEVTFYGTGLNMMSIVDSSSRTVVVSVDGGAEGSNLIGTGSNILNNRNYGANQLYQMVSGLTLGWHTVKIRRTSANVVFVYGFEILNQRTDLAVYQGSGIAQGALNGLSSLATSSFTDGVTGTRGARVVKYIDNGTLKSAVQEVNASAAYLASANHTNEEVVRRINFREFGANRADDFSTLGVTIGSRAFTLDDGTTTLVCTSTGVQGNMLAINNVAGAFVTITFVGTGLDFSVENTWTSPLTFVDVLVDGVSVGALTSYSTTTTNAFRRVSVASGLPYGTHTVRFATNVSVNAGITDFIIYQPKKPSIPAGALEVADYNVPATYVPSTNAALGFLGNGVIRKVVSAREAVYTGAWTLSGTLDPTSFDNFINLSSAASGATSSYTFFGTGFEWKSFVVSAQVNNVTFSINGSSNLSAFTTSLIQTSTGATFTPATGVFGGTNAANNRVRIQVSNLPLGLYTVTLTKNSTSTTYSDSFDIITPIHINQPSLKTGSLSLKSATKYSPEKAVSNAGPDLSKAKAWVVFDTATNKILKSVNVSAVLTQAGGVYVIYLEKPFKDASYICVGSIDQPIAGGSAVTFRTWKKNANHTYVETFNTAGANTAGPFTAAFFGELIDE
jgi:hypothetical protein